MVVTSRFRRRLFAFLVALGTAALIVVSALVAEAIMRHQVIRRAADLKVAALDRDVQLIERRLSARVNDLAFLKSLAEQEISSGPANLANLTTFNKVAKTLVGGSGFYLDTRLFDASGQEVVVFRNLGDPSADSSQLEKNGSPELPADFLEHLRYEGPGFVHLALLEASTESGNKTVLVLGTRVENPDGSPAGFLVMSYHLHSLLRELDTMATPGDLKALISISKRLMIVSRGGGVWQFELLTPASMPPVLVEKPMSKSSGDWVMEAGNLYCVRMLTPPSAAMGPFAPNLAISNPESLDWRVVAMVPRAVLAAEIRVKQSGVWLVSVVAILLLAPAAFAATLSFQHLSEIRNQLDKVFESSMHGILAVDAVRGEGNEIVGFRIIRSNPAASPLLKPDGSGIVEDLAPWLKEVILKGTSEAREYELRSTGKTQWFSLRATRLGNGAVISCADLTQRKLDEQAVRASEGSLRLAARMSKLGAWWISYPERSLFWSPEVRRIHGVPEDFQPTIETAIGFYPLGIQSRVAQAVEACEKRHEPFDFETEFRDSEGRVLWVRAIGEPEVDPVSGALRRIVGTFQDITEPRNAALALAESRERLSTAFWGAGMSLADWRVSTGEINFDANWAATLGYKLEEIKPTLEFWNSLIPKEDQPAIEEAQRKYFEGEVGLFEAEYRMRAKDGTYRWVLERARITEVDLDGRPMRLSGVLVDITSRKSMEEKLAEALQHEQELTRASQAAERAKRNFLAVMSHEIRTPMNSIIGFAEVLTTGKLPPEELEHIRTIKESGEALLRIINDILDYSRIESGRLQLEKIAFSPRETVESVVSMLSNLAAAKGIGLKGGCASDVPRQLVGDPGRLSQILVNLVGNAIKFTPSGSVDLRVEMAPEQGPVARIRFRVVDTGIGISPDKQESIFEPFTQADATISRSHGGTGLGLSISHLLVNLLGGTLHVKSSPGRGSEFYFDIPFGLRTSTERPSAPPPMRPDVSFARKHPLNILVAEDDRVNARLTRLMLEKLGYSPTIVPDGRAAVDAACARPFDLILMDLHMPRMDGIEATLAVRSYEMQTSQTHRTRIVAFTADVLPEERQSCMDAGMDDYLTKPLSLAKLCEALKEAADRVTLSSQLS